MQHIRSSLQRIGSYRLTQFVGAFGLVSALCYYLTTSEQKDVFASAIAQYWEKLYSSSRISALHS